MFICVFVCLFVCLPVCLIILEHPQEYALKILWRLDLIWPRYIGFLKMFIFLFVCVFVCLYFLFASSWDTHRMISWKFCKDWTWFAWGIVDFFRTLISQPNQVDPHEIFRVYFCGCPKMIKIKKTVQQTNKQTNK